MLKILDPAGSEKRLCDGVSRRNFLKIGALGAAGLTLPQLFALEGSAGIRNSRKSVILGATDRLGGEPVDRPVKFQEAFATLYHHLGIDVRTATIPDLNGRPQYLVDPEIEPLRELV